MGEEGREGKKKGGERRGKPLLAGPLFKSRLRLCSSQYQINSNFLTIEASARTPRVCVCENPPIVVTLQRNGWEPGSRARNLSIAICKSNVLTIVSCTMDDTSIEKVTNGLQKNEKDEN